MVGRGRDRSSADRARTLAEIEVDVPVATGWSEPSSDAIAPPAAKVERAPLDDDARDRIDVAQIPDSPPP